MACSNSSLIQFVPAKLSCCLVALALTGCSVVGSRESPLKEVTAGSPTVLDVYRGKAPASQPAAKETARDRLAREAVVRPVAQGDELTQRYWSALEPLQQRFARVPNPDLVMVVYPHLAKGKYPVPGYVTVFPMYERAEYAMPGEVTEDLRSSRIAREARQ
ncbi:TIGR03751 family conjugal transfer lipoprotein [Comamonas aquatica]|jgi:conjugative transfer region lipoprotein (TIGR03751 family)|uniref:TIGR03751 family conjugal transfer lipoprotein n=1 Tax=Comamonas aquatica TaxID=225991 RepID=UPI0021B1557C|nr:TIGR03751 family conjugal transfer lipoprotein [Comamonas aquatica]